MIARRSLRRWIALVAMPLVVSAQSAAAAFACTRGADVAPAASASPACPEHLREAADPAEAGGTANLCEVHCQDTSVAAMTADVAAPPPAAGVEIPAPAPLAEGLPARAPDAKGTAPPVRSRYCRLQL